MGFFLHTPFPPPDLLRVLPNHRQLVEQLCAYDLIGFQTSVEVNAFCDYVVREAGGRLLGSDRVEVFGRRVKVEAFPVGIDVDAVATAAAASAASAETSRLTESLLNRNLIIGVDRLDYSKGIVQRFSGYSRLLDLYPYLRGSVIFLQIAPPSRSEVPEYAEIRREVEETAGQINGANAGPDWTPLRYVNQGFAQDELMGYFRCSRIGLVTPFRDGMNLVAKEYVAAQDGADPGVLILSQFAGAARELSAAVLVNPDDLDGMAEAMANALDMPGDERRERWSDMMRVLRRGDITTWRETFLDRLANASNDHLAACS